MASVTYRPFEFTVADIKTRIEKRMALYTEVAKEHHDKARSLIKEPDTFAYRNARNSQHRLELKALVLAEVLEDLDDLPLELTEGN